MRPVTITRFVCLFTLLSLVPLGGALVSGASRDGEAYRVLSAVVDGVPHPAVGLTYDGDAGQTMLLGQVVLVLVCGAAALLARGVAQRAGVGVLCLWATVWTFNAGQAAVVTGLYGFWGAFALTGLWLTLSLIWFAQLCVPRPHVTAESSPSLA